MNQTNESMPRQSSSSELSDDHPDGGQSIAATTISITPTSAPPSPRWVKKLLQLLGMRKDSTLEESVAELIEEHKEEGIPLSLEERVMITNVIGFKDLHVEDVMVPRSDIVAIPADISLPDLRALILEKEHTRMPVYHDSLDDVLGFIHIKDFIRYIGTDTPFAIKDIIRNILVVPPSMPVIDLLVKMRASRVHIALVVDEHGGTDGLVTIEDLVEEIVGDIEDEHDIEEEVEILEISKDTLDVSARMKIEDLEEKLHIKLVEDIEEVDYETIGGLLFALASRVPEVGEIITHPSGIEFEVTEADPRRVKRVLITHIPEQPTANA